MLNGVTLREPEKTGYRFTGWYFDSSVPAADADKTKPVYSLPLMDKKGDWVAADVTLCAKWEAIEYPIIYYTPLAAGKSANPDTYTVEDTVTLSPADYSGRPLTPAAGIRTGHLQRGHADRPACHRACLRVRQARV